MTSTFRNYSHSEALANGTEFHKFYACQIKRVLLTEAQKEIFSNLKTLLEQGQDWRVHVRQSDRKFWNLLDLAKEVRIPELCEIVQK